MRSRSVTLFILVLAVLFSRRAAYVKGPCAPTTSLSTSLLAVAAQNEDVSKELSEFLTMGFRNDFKKSKIGHCIENSPALVLNADYSPLSYMPLSLWSWQDTLRAVLSERAVVVSEYSNLVVRGVNWQLNLPSVIALSSYQKIPDKVPTMSRRNVYIRDNFKCQYCLETFAIEDLSLDHVVPRSQGGKLTWTNTVTACCACNFKKGTTLPEQLPRLGMRLREKPKVPSYHELQMKSKLYRKSQLHESWSAFI